MTDSFWNILHLIMNSVTDTDRETDE